MPQCQTLLTPMVLATATVDNSNRTCSSNNNTNKCRPNKSEPPGTQKYACLYAPGIQNPMMQQQQGSVPNAQKSAPGNGGGPIGNVANQVFMQQQERMQTYVTFFPPAIQNPMMQQQQVAASGMQQQQGPWFKMHQMHVRNYPYPPQGGAAMQQGQKPNPKPGVDVGVGGAGAGGGQQHFTGVPVAAMQQGQKPNPQQQQQMMQAGGGMGAPGGPNVMDPPTPQQQQQPSSPPTSPRSATSPRPSASPLPRQPTTQPPPHHGDSDPDVVEIIEIQDPFSIPVVIDRKRVAVPPLLRPKEEVPKKKIKKEKVEHSWPNGKCREWKEGRGRGGPWSTGRWGRGGAPKIYIHVIYVWGNSDSREA